MSGVGRTREEARSIIGILFQAGLDAANPRLAVARAVQVRDGRLVVGGESIELKDESQLRVVAIGKAAVPMAHGFINAVGGLASDGIILTKDGHGDQAPNGWPVYEAAHPVPDDRGVAATNVIEDAVSGLSEHDVVVVLVSGGGSALLEHPQSPLTLDDIQVTTRLLLRAGAPIQDLNAVRSELSEVKGGGLRRTIGAARCVSIILSDVLGNDPQVIASGPTIVREPDPSRALELLDRYEIRDQVPGAVIRLLETSGQQSCPHSAGDVFALVADNDGFVDAIANCAKALGYSVEIAGRQCEGESREVARWFVETATASPADVVLAGGELTVTVRGDGVGGRNTEFALAAAIQMANRGIANRVVASLASDGQDGSIDAAGAIVDDGVVERLRLAGIDASTMLEANDTGTALERIDALVRPGPTGTNVNDVYMAISVAPERANQTADR